VRAGQAAGKYGWDAPLTLEIKTQAAAFAAAFSEAAPAGRHSHDMIANAYKPAKRIKSGKNAGKITGTEFPRGGTNRLKEWFRHIPNWQLVYKKGSFHHASISVFLAYARIIDEGGHVRDTFLDNSPAMCMAFKAGGKDVCAKYRVGYTIKAQHYIENGLDNYISLRGDTGMKVGWRPPIDAN